MSNMIKETKLTLDISNNTLKSDLQEIKNENEKILETLNKKIDHTTFQSKIDSLKSDLDNKINTQDHQSNLKTIEEQLNKNNQELISNLKNEITKQLNELKDNNIALVDSLKNVIKKEEEEESKKIMQGFNSNRGVTSKHESEWWCSKSEYILNGAFEAKISIIKIDEIQAKGHYNYSLAMIKSNSSIVHNFHPDSLVFSSHGQFHKYDKNGATLFNSIWKSGDTIVVKRDKSNNVYFGINNDIKLAYKDIDGSFRILFGFRNEVAKYGDIFEFSELNET